MKKLPLVIAMISLFSATTIFSAESDSDAGMNSGATSPVSDAQIFKQSFDLMVEKESEISIEPPAKEVIDINIDELEEMAATGEDIIIGAMEVETTARKCYAKITTMNDFQLQGMPMQDKKGERNTLASYSLQYMVENNSNTDVINAEFASNYDGEQIVGCDTANLKMNIVKYHKGAPADAYNDVITVEVRAES